MIPPSPHRMNNKKPTTSTGSISQGQSRAIQNAQMAN